jgi:uncharacterized surface protein with fasciclin (FAS1) repeats
MFDMPDLRGKLPIKKACPNSLLSVIENTPDFSLFLYMVRLANLQEFLNLKQANFTIFIPSNKELLKHLNQNIFTNMDSNTAWYIVRSSILNDRIPSEILEDSPAAYFYTLSEANRLFITNISGITYVNNTLRVIHKDISCTNGMIHVTDGLFIPNIL